MPWSLPAPGSLSWPASTIWKGAGTSQHKSEKQAEKNRHLLRLAPTKDVDRIEHRDALVHLNRPDQVDCLRCELADIARLGRLGCHAVVARLVALFARELFAKVLQNLAAPAVVLVDAVLDDAADVGAVVVLLLARSFALLDEAHNELGIGVRVEEDTGRSGAVSTGSSSLLQGDARGQRMRAENGAVRRT